MKLSAPNVLPHFPASPLALFPSSAYLLPTRISFAPGTDFGVTFAMSTFLYFAYGSNMLAARLKRRCSSATLMGSAVAVGYKLTFSKKSKDGSGKATIEEATDPDDSVYGVLFRIPDCEKPKLDEYEGPGYQIDDQFSVIRTPNNQESFARIYFAVDSINGDELSPYDWYLNLIIAGAVEAQSTQQLY